MAKICDVKGFHEYTDWRTIEESRTESTMTGMSYVMAKNNYYIRNCKFCGRLDSASNEVEMGIKSRTCHKVKHLGLVRTEGSK